MSSSTTRAATVGITLPTDPSLRIASCANSMHVTGDISVWPNAAKICVPGKVSDMSRSRVSDAGAAPHDSTRSLSSRGSARWAAHTACHCAGTRKIDVTFSGMVQLEPHRGHVVLPLSRADIEDIFWLQATIAKELAATAAERITDAEIDELERLNDNLASAVGDRDPDQVASAEFAFHRAFNHAPGRIKLAWFLLHVARYLPPLIYAGDPQWGAAAVANHRELIAALRRRDVGAVVRLTSSQFTDGAQRLTARLDEIGLWS